MSLIDPKNEVKTSSIKFSKPGDWVEGALIGVRDIIDPRGKPAKIYELKTDGGSFHDADAKKNPIEPAITVEAGQIWAVWGKVALDNQMRNVKVGQKIALKFEDEKPSKHAGHNPMKNIKLYTKGEIDEELLAEIKNQQEIKNF